MANKNMDEWKPFLETVLAQWDENELGADYEVVGLKRAQVAALQTKWNGFGERIEKAQAALDKVVDERQNLVPQLNELGVAFRSSMAGKFGPSSDEAKRAPRVTAGRKARKSGTTGTGG